MTTITFECPTCGKVVPVHLAGEGSVSASCSHGSRDTRKPEAMVPNSRRGMKDEPKHREVRTM